VAGGPAHGRQAGGVLTVRERLAGRLVGVEADELGALCWSFLYFFCLLCGYYIVRPMRDEMGIAGGVDNLQWLFTGTFVAMLAAVPLFGWVSSRFPRRRFLPYVYAFFIANLAVFFALFELGATHAYVARAFFIWASVYNLFIVSVFWSFMADVWSPEQAKRLFAVIAAGGTSGAIAGPALTATLAVAIGPTNLLLISSAFLACAVVCIVRLARWRWPRPRARERGPAPGADPGERPIGGNVLAAFPLVLRSPYLLGICALMLLLTTLATFLYFQQAHIIAQHFDDPARRTALFAGMDLAVNVLTLGAQVFVTGRIVRRLGLPFTLAALPVALALGFVALALAPVLAVLVVVQVLRRAGNYALMRPAREMLYSVLGAEEKYKAKNFIDTVIYRGGDAASAWLYAGLTNLLGLGLAGVALLAAPLALAWAGVACALGRAREARAARLREAPPPVVPR